MISKYYQVVVYSFLFLFIVVGFTGCASRQEIRHLASEVSLLSLGGDEQEVRGVLGVPDFRRSLADGAEEWIYLDVHKSRMRRVKLAGRFMGHEDYHLAIITIQNGKIADMVYRNLTTKQYREYLSEVSSLR